MSLKVRFLQLSVVLLAHFDYGSWYEENGERHPGV